MGLQGLEQELDREGQPGFRVGGRLGLIPKTQPVDDRVEMPVEHGLQRQLLVAEMRPRGLHRQTDRGGDVRKGDVRHPPLGE